jgi:PhnB protein
MHANLTFGDSHLFLADEMPGRGCTSSQAPQSINATMHLYVEDVDKTYERAIAAGAKSDISPQDMFWGDRYGRLVDPFGQPWSLASHIEDLTQEEMQKRSEDFCKQMAMAK